MKKNSLLMWLLGALFFSAILFLNWTFSFSSDDCTYALIGTGAWDNNGVPPHLCTIANAWIENWHDGYRPVVHFFARIFTGCFDKWVFNIANTCMMGLLVLCILRLAKKRINVEFTSFSWLLVLVFFVLCKGESYLWCAGSVNYLWAGTGSLVFCLLAERLERKDTPWSLVVLYCVIALFAGWLQEAFVLPIGCALATYYVLNYKSFTLKKAVLFIFYVVGVILLVRIAGRRASTIPSFSFTTLCMTVLKIVVAIKAFWALLVVFLFCRDKRAFIVRNMFLLMVVGASIGMIAIVGFNGERSLWAANLFSIVILVREFTPSLRVSYLLSLALTMTLMLCCCFGYRIKCEFNDFAKQYIMSENGLCWHNRVDCGLFARFFHQCIYTWENGGHGKTFGFFCGRNVAPIALSKADYDAVVANEFCVPSNRINIAMEAYTTQSSNTIIVPLKESDLTPVSVIVAYDYPQDFVSKVKRELEMRKNPPVANANVPREVVINGGRFAFVSKEPGSDSYIRDITFGF